MADNNNNNQPLPSRFTQPNDIPHWLGVTPIIDDDYSHLFVYSNGVGETIRLHRAFNTEDTTSFWKGQVIIYPVSNASSLAEMLIGYLAMGAKVKATMKVSRLRFESETPLEYFLHKDTEVIFRILFPENNHPNFAFKFCGNSEEHC